MTRHAVLANRKALGLLGSLSVQRIATAGFPVAFVVVSFDTRGAAIAAVLQALRVFIATFSAPLRARALDRLGRHRVIVPQTVLTSVLWLLLCAALVDPNLPLALVLAATIAPSAVSPSISSVIRTLWRTIGEDEQQVKALHSYDSILEEMGFLLGPAAVSGLMLAVGHDLALWVIVAAMIAGYVLPLLSRDVRSALRPRPNAAPSTPPVAVATGRARRFVRTLAGPIASKDLQRIVFPLILMGGVFGVVGILAPILATARGHSDATGFLLATISLGGVIGALGYGTITIKSELRARHAVLGIIFGVPLLLGLLADSLWLLGTLLAIAGLAVTPLYINAYLMMDKEIPDAVIHEANTWVPVGNNVGYVIGISLGAAVLGRNDIPAALVTITAIAALLVVYSLIQLALVRRAAHTRQRQDDPLTEASTR